MYLFYISFILENVNTTCIFFGEYIVHLHCQCERGVIHTKIVCLCFKQVYVYRIAYFPFHSVFHSLPISVPISVPFSVPRFSNTGCENPWGHINSTPIWLQEQVFYILILHLVCLKSNQTKKILGCVIILFVLTK